MMQEESNGEASFEIVEKKMGDLSTNSDKSEATLSGVSSPYSLPSPGLVNIPSGNLISNVAPPSQLPDFALWQAPPPQVLPPPSANAVPFVPPPVVYEPAAPSSIYIESPGEQYPATQFSAAIPPSKGMVHGPILIATEDKQNSGLFGMVKGAFTSGGVLSKMAEKAKSSVDTIITTLDPQMSAYLNSAGDTEVTVTSENEDLVSAVREAFHSVFGKAWVNGIKLGQPPASTMASGFEEALQRTEEQIEQSIKYRPTPTVAIEHFLLQQSNDWYEVSALVLVDFDRDIHVKTFSQLLPVPVGKIQRQIEVERPDLKELDTKGQLLSYLKMSSSSWKQSVYGLTNKELLLLPAKTLVRMYKNEITEKF